MDSVLSDWNRFSLTEKEVPHITLNSGTKKQEHALAAKFLTKRMLNAEAIGRTFKPLWKSKRSFQVRDVGNHIMIFVFESEIDVEKVLMNEPWTFDKHLVLFKRYVSGLPIRQIQFTSIPFWLQLHGLPIDHLTEENAILIGNTVGNVIHSQVKEELVGGDFLRIRVSVETTKPLCRGRKILLDTGKEIWVSFKYEKIPNFCYWCGFVSHDDKDCNRWLASKGTLDIAKQEYGAWLRAPPFNHGKKTVVSVRGLDEEDDVGSLSPPSAAGGRATPQTPTHGDDTSQSDPYPHDTSTEHLSPEIPVSAEQVTKSTSTTKLPDPTDIVSPKSPAALNLRTEVTEGAQGELQKLTPMDNADNNNKGTNISLNPTPLIYASNPITLSDSSPNYPSEHIVETTTEVVTDTSNLRSWKRIVRNRGSADQTMQVVCSGKRANRDEDDDHSELPSKRLQVSSNDLDNSYTLAEAVRQPRHLQ